ncbi:hypothetical protein FC89_GL000305 [Liquorilactobacillus ghanensis DSM 18630]|uniref:Phage protein n=1 Tax=Liquorilactobacillus ghanensis DSM 18630 TaxID=1423750 RepID=A0A0R1VU95_9LACO|nr:hypothetical protein [Liquorilactobacillus ghanensis]KRM06996.1 hypothetical protein FC89_GL000305 [Liquorilactobacillus ghanensis DSM 18630]
MNNNENEFLNWNEGWVAEESEFTLLPEGNYPFQVTNLERKIYSGQSSKIPNGAPYAEVTVEVDGGEKGKTTIKERLYLMKKFTWKLTQFFNSIGQVQEIGQPFQPKWNQVIGASGQAKLEVNNYTDKDGNKKQNNRVKEFLKPTANAGVVQQQPNFNQQAPQQPTQPNQQWGQQQGQQQGGFQTGAF